MTLPKQLYYKKNCLQQLKGFCYTVQTGNMSKAAEKMGLNQSTITLQIQSLERDLKTKLFDRDRKQITLNEDGEKFYEIISYHLSGIESSYKKFLDKNNDQENQVRIAVHHAAISYLLPLFIKKFQDQYPHIKIIIKNIPSHLAIKLLENNELDLILYPNVNPPKGLFSRVCFSYNPILIMHKNHPLTKENNIRLQDISKYNVIRVDNELLALPFFEKMFEELKFKTNINFENGDFEMIKNFVKAEIGLGIISELCVKKDEKNLIIKNLNNYFPKIEYKLVIKNGKHLNFASEEFVKVLVNKSSHENIIKKI